MKIDQQTLTAFSNNLVTALTILGIFGLVGSLSRIADIGFTPEHAVHIVLVFLITATFLARHRLSARANFYMTMLFFAGIALAGMFFAGASSHFLFFASILLLLVALAFGMKAAIMVAVAIFFITFYAAYLFVNDIYVPNIDYNHYMTSWTGWIPITIIVLATSLALVQTISNMYQRLLKIQEELFRARKKAEDLANHDALTGLLSLRMADELMEWSLRNAKRNKTKVAVVFLDLNGFKAINDHFGHQAGDTVLRLVAKRMKSIIREVDSVCRIGGDEFFIIMPDIQHKSDIEAICERIIHSIERPIEYKQKQIQVGVSVGIALYPDDAEDSSRLKNLADKSMYQVKKLSSSGYAFTDSSKKPQDSSIQRQSAG